MCKAGLHLHYGAAPAAEQRAVDAGVSSKVTAPPGLVTLCLDLILSRKQTIKPGANLVFDWP